MNDELDAPGLDLIIPDITKPARCFSPSRLGQPAGLQAPKSLPFSVNAIVGRRKKPGLTLRWGVSALPPIADVRSRAGDVR